MSTGTLWRKLKGACIGVGDLVVVHYVDEIGIYSELGSIANNFDGTENKASLNALDNKQ